MQLFLRNYTLSALITVDIVHEPTSGGQMLGDKQRL